MNKDYDETETRHPNGYGLFPEETRGNENQKKHRDRLDHSTVDVTNETLTGCVSSLILEQDMQLCFRINLRQRKWPVNCVGVMLTGKVQKRQKNI